MYRTYADVVKLNNRNSSRNDDPRIRWQSPRNPAKLYTDTSQIRQTYAIQNRFLPLTTLPIRDQMEQRQKNQLTLCLWNAQSLRHKTQLVKSYIDENDIDLYFIVETWLSNDETAVIGELEDGGKFRMINNPRHGRSGGGLCCLHKSSLKVRKQTTISRTTMEIMETTAEGPGL